MYEIKKQIYLDFTKNQKSALCNFLRALVKKSQDLSIEDIWASFVADEKYYLELNCSRFEFLSDIIDEESFKSDTIKYLKECKKYYDYREKQRPIIEANKEYEKKKRKFLQEVKMSKETPTKKQLYYFFLINRTFPADFPRLPVHCIIIDLVIFSTISKHPYRDKQIFPVFTLNMELTFQR